jgi:hypothetical protein
VPLSLSLPLAPKIGKRKHQAKQQKTTEGGAGFNAGLGMLPGMKEGTERASGGNSVQFDLSHSDQNQSSICVFVSPSSILRLLQYIPQHTDITPLCPLFYWQARATT